MSESIEIKIVIDPSLVEYFRQGLQERHIEYSVADEMTGFLTMILNDTMYPVVSSRTGEKVIHLDYRPRAFADPIF